MISAFEPSLVELVSSNKSIELYTKDSTLRNHRMHYKANAGTLILNKKSVQYRLVF